MTCLRVCKYEPKPLVQCMNMQCPCGEAESVVQDVTVPMAAHTLANLASAVIWRRQARADVDVDV